MANLAENPKADSSQQEKPEEPVGLTQYKKRFEDAVADAQYLMIYASSKCPNDINRETMEKLINARHRVENDQGLSTKEEADFWLAYQDLWKLVQPATAESIKANLPIERTFSSKFLGNIPILSRWLGKRNASKARRTVNSRIVYTVITLVFLLIFQIYWVIGNQLTAQVAELLQKEADISLQIDESNQEYSKLELRYMQTEIDSGKFNGSYYIFYDTPEWKRDILDYTSAKAKLETNLELLKSQLERNSAIIVVWSKPWNWLIDEDTEQVTHNDKYAPQFEFLESQIKALDEQLKNDPNGSQAAENQKRDVDAQLAGIDGQLNVLFEQYNTLVANEEEIQKQITAMVDKGTLEAQLPEFEASQRDIQRQIDEVAAQLSSLSGDSNADKSALEAQLTELTARQADIQGKLDEVNAQLTVLSNNPDADKSALEAQLNEIGANKSAVRDQIVNLQSQIQYYVVDPQVLADQFVTQWRLQKDQLINDRKTLERQELADASREKSRQAQLAGQFVLVVLQSYLLPLLYGILGASTSVLRTLSKQIETVTYSEEAAIQHLLRISLGALAGIMVGWFSFLLPKESTTFLGSVSPLAIAFLVGYNIELFFSLMDLAIKKVNNLSRGSETGKDDQTAITQPPSNLPPAEETPPVERPASEESAG